MNVSSKPFNSTQHFISFYFSDRKKSDWTTKTNTKRVHKDQHANMKAFAKQLDHFHLFKIIVSKTICKNFLVECMNKLTDISIL